MAKFLPAFERTLLLEGGLQLTDVVGDHGGQTYAGLSRRANPEWGGWAYIDQGNIPPASLVQQVYRGRYWDAIYGDNIQCQSVAESIYDFSVNAGPKVAIKRAQYVLGVDEDGVMGPQTLTALNACEEFHMPYTVAKIGFYAAIANKNRSQVKFLLGWVNRSLHA